MYYKFNVAGYIQYMYIRLYVNYMNFMQVWRDYSSRTKTGFP